MIAASILSSAAVVLSLAAGTLLGTAATLAVSVMRKKKHAGGKKICRWEGAHVPCLDVLSSLGDGVVIADSAGRILFINPSAEKMFGIKLSKTQGRHYRDALHITEYGIDATPFDPFAEVLRTGKPVVASRRFRIMAQDGKTWTVSDRIMAIFRPDATEPHMIMVIHDAGELWEQQLRLQASLDKANGLNEKLNEVISEYEMLVDIMPVYFYIKDADDGFKYLKCNRICGNLWGLPVSGIVGKTDEELFGDREEVRIFHDSDVLAMQNSLMSENVLPFTDKKGQRRIGRFYRHGVKMADGRRRLFGLVVDITEEQNQHARLSAALNAFEYAFDMTQIAIFRLDVETRRMYGAKKLASLWPIHDGIGKLWNEVVDAEDLEKFGAEREKLLSGQSKKMIVDYRSTCFGSLKYYRMEAGLDHDTDGKTTVLGIIQDVTADKERERNFNAELLRQNSILNAILGAIPSQVFIKDVNDNFRYKLANRNFTEYYRLTENEVVGHVDFEIFPEAVAEQLRSHDTEVCAAVGKVFRFDEDISYMQYGLEIFKSLKVCFETADHHKYLLGVCVDITELQTAGKKAEETAEWLRLTLNSIGDGVLATDLDGNISMMNPVAERMTGVNFEQAKGKPHEQVFRISSALDDSPMPSPVTRALRTGNVVELANHTDLVGMTGKRYHIADSAAPIFNSEHAIIGAILVFRDVTDEYIQRDTLHATMAQMELGAEMTHSASFRLNPESLRISGSKLLPTLWPLNNGVAENPENWVFHDDAAEFRRLLKSFADGGSEVRSCVYRAGIGNDLRQYQISMVFEPLSSQGNAVVGVIQDVTEIRESAAKLKATQELWELIINSIPTMFFAKDADDGFRYTLCNQAFADFLGRTPAEVIGRTDAELFAHPGEIRQHMQKDRQIMQSVAGERFEEISTDYRGAKHFIRSFKRPILDVGNRNMLLGVCVDITEIHNLLQFEHVNNAVLAYAVSEPEFAPLVDKVLQTMLACLKCDRVIFAALGNDGLLHRYQDVYSEKSRSLATIGVSYHEELWNLQLLRFKNHEFVAYEKFADIPGSEKLLERDSEYSTSSAAGIPVFVGDEFIGVLIVSFVEKHIFEKMDERIMQAMASMIALARIRETQRQAVRRAEALNQTILDNLNIPVWLYDVNGVVVQTNRAAVELLDGAEIGHMPYDCRNVLTCKKTDAECPIRRCIVSRHATQCGYQYLNGREFIADARPIFDSDGNMVNVVKSFFDITSLRRMIGNQQLLNECLANLLREKDIMRALELSLRSICEHTGVDRCFIIKFNPERKTFSSFIEVSRSNEPSSFGSYKDEPYSAVPSLESRFRESPVLSIPDFRASIEREGLSKWKPVIERHDCRSFYAHRINFNGDLWGYAGLMYEKTIKELTSEELEFFGAVASCVELTLERQKNQQEVLAELKKAKAADRAKSLFLASMSHEIRTPLNAVIGFSELLKDGTLPQSEQKEYLANIFTAGNALLLLINDVLDLSKLEAGQMVLTPEPVDFSALVHEVGGIFKHKCTKRGIDFSLVVPDDMPLVWIDKLRIRQVLFNLIGNAVKFTDQGGISIKVEFERKNEAGGDFSFHVIDTGCGIAPDEQAKVFQLFVQSAALRGTKIAENGTGLGLAICKRLVEQMNGVIELHSEPGRGSDFSVQLYDVRFSVAAKSVSLSSIGAKPEKLHRGGGLTALLVDDVLMNLQVMAAMLNKIGVTTVQASNGIEALQRLESGGIDFVLTDMWMPGLNGAELAVKIRENQKTSGMPVFAVTADVEADENFSLDVFAGVLLKPVTGDKLKKLVASIALHTGR